MLFFYKWQCTSEGCPASMPSTAIIVLAAGDLVPGSYTFEATVSKPDGQLATTAVGITVQPGSACLAIE